MSYCMAACGCECGEKEECATCEARAPALFPENRDAWRLWNAACTQWRTSFGGVVGIDYTAVFYIAQAMDIEITPALMEKLKRLEMYEVSRLNKEEDHGSD